MDNSITRIMVLIILIVLVSFPVSAWSLKDFIKTIYKPKQITTQPIINQQKPVETDYKNLYEKQLKVNDELSKENTRIRIEMASTLASQKIEYEKYLWNKNYYVFYPTKCDHPTRKFTMCKEGYGCDYKYYCDTYSMNPLFWCNAKLTLAECSLYSVGDIVLIKNHQKLNSKYDYIIHSIVGIEKGKFITKGYNNNAVDDFTSQKDDILGKVIKIEY